MPSKQTLTIGFAVFNGEKFLRRRLENILSQTFEDFSLIISDNASTDKTSNICQEYQKKDSRIKYFRQPSNSGGINNFLWLLDKAKTEYFVWAAVDDIWSSNFLECNLSNLREKNDIIGSISNLYYFDNYEKFDIKTFDINSYNKTHVLATSGNYEERVSKYVGFNQTSVLYSIFRTRLLQQSVVRRAIVAWDTALIFRVLKHGNFNINFKSSMYRFSKGTAWDKESLSYKTSLSERKITFVEAMLTFLPFTLISLRTMGIRIFSKNIKWFFLLNFRGERKFYKDLLGIKNKI